MRRRSTAIAVVSAVLVAVVAFAMVMRSTPAPPEHVAPAQAEPVELAPVDAHWIVAGGGPLPESNELSIEDDVLLATRTFEGPGLTYFASGAGSRAVRVEATDLTGDPVLSALGAFFSPRAGRASRYAPTRLREAQAATPARFLGAVEAAVGAAGPPLLVYVAGHGEAGATPAENTVAMWANTSFTPMDLADALAPAQRQTRVVVTTCFSGGFAELAFADADEKRGAATADICGLFASTWDREAGGCDPNPDRGMHDGYGVHFLSALAGERSDGERLEATVDVDGDTVISLLDAHTFARLNSTSIDVPTTTSERWLRAQVADDVTGPALALPHESAVIAALTARLGVADEAAARARLAEIDARLQVTADGMVAAAEVESNAYWDAAGELLSQWPVLDDPWHPLWRETVERERAAIERHLKSSDTLRAWRTAVAAVDALAATESELEVQRAPLHRLVRAFETQRLAGALRARGGAAWARFQAFRACEASAP